MTGIEHLLPFSAGKVEHRLTISKMVQQRGCGVGMPAKQQDSVFVGIADDFVLTRGSKRRVSGA
jgi:hypothetical protein